MTIEILAIPISLIIIILVHVLLNLISHKILAIIGIFLSVLIYFLGSIFFLSQFESIIYASILIIWIVLSIFPVYKHHHKDEATSNFYQSVIIFLGGIAFYKIVFYLFNEYFFWRLDVFFFGNWGTDEFYIQYYRVYSLYLFITGFIYIAFFGFFFIRIEKNIFYHLTKGKFGLAAFIICGIEVIFEFLIIRVNLSLSFRTLFWISLIPHFILSLNLVGLLIYAIKHKPNDRDYCYFLLSGTVLTFFLCFPFSISERDFGVYISLFRSLSLAGLGLFLIGAYLTTLTPLLWQKEQKKSTEFMIEQNNNKTNHIQ